MIMIITSNDSDKLIYKVDVNRGKTKLPQITNHRARSQPLIIFLVLGKSQCLYHFLYVELDDVTLE